MKLSAIQNERAETTVPVAGETLTVGYRPGVYTVKFLQELPGKSVAEVLQQIVCDWDLTDDQGEALPITLETLEKVPLPLQRKIWSAIEEALAPN